MIASVTLGVPDLDRAMTFYRQFMEVIGWEEKFATRRSPPGPWAGFHPIGADGPLLIVAHPDCPHSAALPGTGPVVTFEVPTRGEVDAAHAEALALGGTEVRAPAPAYPAPGHAAVVTDPFGNRLAILCRATN